MVLEIVYTISGIGNLPDYFNTLFYRYSNHNFYKLTSVDRGEIFVNAMQFNNSYLIFIVA